MLVMQCLTSRAMDLSAACDLPPCHLSGLLFGHVRCFPVQHIFCSLHCICVILACLFFSRLFVEWYLDLRVFFWGMAGNSLSAKDKYAGFEGQHLPQPIKAATAEFSRANKCLLTLEHGTVSSCEAK